MRRDLIAFYVEDQIISIQVQPINWFSRKNIGGFLNEAYLRRTYLQGRMHVLAGTVARTCVEGRYVLPDFTSNACPLCLKRLPSLPQTLSSVPANVINRSRKRLREKAPI